MNGQWRWAWWLASVIALLESPPPATGAPIAFAFHGTVESVFDGLQTLSPRIEPGAPFRGLYVFDSDTHNTAPPGGEGEFGLYHHGRPPAGLAVRVVDTLDTLNASLGDFDSSVAVPEPCAAFVIIFLGIQLLPILTVRGGQLDDASRLANGPRYEAFILKYRAGQPNEVIDCIPSSRERFLN